MTGGSIALPRLRIRRKRKRPLSPWGRFCLAMAAIMFVSALVSWLRVFSGQWIIGVAKGALSDGDVFWSILLGLFCSWRGHWWWRQYRIERDRDDD